MINIAVIGGGASGLFAAIYAAKGGANVTIFEKNDRVGKKILATGNGRCNLSNENIMHEYYNNKEFVEPTITNINAEKLIKIFENMGLLTVADNEGRLYPLSNTATSVLDILRLECKKYSVKEKVSCEVISIQNKKNKFFVKTKYNDIYEFDKIIYSVGGNNRLSKNLGLNTVSFSPILCPLKTDTSKIKGLSGLRIKCSVSLYDGNNFIYKENGEILFRDYGVSGIVIFNISRFLKQGNFISIDFLPEHSKEEIIDMLNKRKKNFKERIPEDFLTGIFHRKLSEAILKISDINKHSEIAENIKDFKLKIKGVGDENQAQVTRGGISLDEIDNKTFESKKIKGLFVTGEALDVDAPCGGYNLHFAFSSGIIAGMNAVKK